MTIIFMRGCLPPQVNEIKRGGKSAIPPALHTVLKWLRREITGNE
jgi:hypothetical protein